MRFGPWSKTLFDGYAVIVGERKVIIEAALLGVTKFSQVGDFASYSGTRENYGLYVAERVA